MRTTSFHSSTKRAQVKTPSVVNLQLTRDKAKHRHSSTTMSTASDDEYTAEQAERHRRSASPSPEVRQTPIRDRMEVLPSLPKESFPNVEIKEIYPIMKELSPQQSREPYPSERFPHMLRTSKKNLYPETKVTKGFKTMAGQEEPVQAMRWELEVSAPGSSKLQPPEDHRRQIHSNQRVSTQRELSGPRGRWGHDLFEGDDSSIDSTPWFERQEAARSYASTSAPSSLLQSRPLEQRCKEESQGMETLSKATSSSMIKSGAHINLNTTASLNPSQKSKLPGTREAIFRDETYHIPHDTLSTPTTKRYNSPDHILQTAFLFSTPDKQQLSSPEPQTPQTSPSASTSTTRRRPETNDLVARRMIGSALGLRIPKRVDDRSIEIAEEMRAKRMGSGSGDRRTFEEITKARNDEK